MLQCIYLIHNIYQHMLLTCSGGILLSTAVALLCNLVRYSWEYCPVVRHSDDSRWYLYAVKPLL